MTTPAYDAIYLSPHLDDVVLSCGGAIHQQVQGEARVLVVSFFAGSPPDDSITAFARDLKARWGGAEDPVAVRRAEDLAALRVLGADGAHLPFYDCVYRQHSGTGDAYYPGEASIFGEVHAAEMSLPIELLSAFLAQAGDVGRATLYGPLAAGHHVDHLLVRAVALLLQQCGLPVLFYEDYPYAGDVDTVRAARARWPEACWSAQPVFFDEQDLEAKADAVACHTSQISTFWPDLETMRQTLRQQALAVGVGRYAENTWRLLTPCLTTEGRRP